MTPFLPVAAPPRRMARLLATLFLILVGRPAAGDTTNVRWSHFPGFYAPGVGGFAAADLDDDGVDELVVTGRSESVAPPFSTTFIGVLDGPAVPGGAYRTTAMRRLAPGGSIAGTLATLRMPNTADRVVAAYYRPSGTELRTYGGAELELSSVLNVPGYYALQQIADVDADGDLEALGCNCVNGSNWGGGLRLISMTSGELEWESSVASRPRAGQLDADAPLELVFGTGSNGAPGYVVDGATKAIEWTSYGGFRGPATFGRFFPGSSFGDFAVTERWAPIQVFAGNPLYTLVRETSISEPISTAVADTDGDGYDEVLVGRGQWGAIVAYEPQNNSTVFEIPSADSTSLTVGDFDSDDKLELAYATGLGSSTADSLRVVSIPQGAEEFSMHDETGPHSSVLRADLEIDGHDEIVFATISSKSGYAGANVSVLDARTGDLLRGRPAVMWPWPPEAGLAMLSVNVDADPQLELVVGAAHYTYAQVIALDGVTLQPQWTATLDTRAVADLALLEVDDGLRIVVATDGVVVLLDASTGNEDRRSSTYPFENSQRLVVGDVDADGRDEIALSTGSRVHVLDPVSWNRKRLYTMELPVLGHRLEQGAHGCLHIFALATEIRRYHCATGALHSVRALPFEAGLLQFPRSSFEAVVLSNGTRLSLLDPALGSIDIGDLGTNVGWQNRASILDARNRIEVAVGTDDAVHLIEFRLNVFADGFE